MNSFILKPFQTKARISCKVEERALVGLLMADLVVGEALVAKAAREVTGARVVKQLLVLKPIPQYTL